MRIHYIVLENVKGNKMFLAGKANFCYAVALITWHAILHCFIKTDQVLLAQFAQLGERWSSFQGDFIKIITNCPFAEMVLTFMNFQPVEYK